MRISKPDHIDDLIKRFNKSDNAMESYALACALRSQLMAYVDMLDDSILDIYRNAMIKDIIKKDK